MAEQIDGVAAYPNYRFHVVVHFPDGEESDQISLHRMFRDPLEPDMLEREVEAWADLVLHAERPSGVFAERGGTIGEHSATFLHDETWCQGWFEHTSFNVHLSDEDLRADFLRYIDRQRKRARAQYPNDPDLWHAGLMGADDLWRWDGPCRCEHCARREVVKIGH